MSTTKPVRLPFHEAIILMIRNASGSSDLLCLARLIRIVKIPKGHDEIIVAWNERLQGGGLGMFPVDLGIPTDLLEQKEEAVAAEKAKLVQTVTGLKGALALGESVSS